MGTVHRILLVGVAAFALAASACGGAGDGGEPAVATVDVPVGLVPTPALASEPPADAPPSPAADPAPEAEPPPATTPLADPGPTQTTAAGAPAHEPIPIIEPASTSAAGAGRVVVVVVPALAGMAVADAAAVLEELGLGLEVNPPNLDAGPVSHQDPGPGTLVEPDTLVVLTAEPVPEPTPGPVPVVDETAVAPPGPEPTALPVDRTGVDGRAVDDDELVTMIYPPFRPRRPEHDCLRAIVIAEMVDDGTANRMWEEVQENHGARLRDEGLEGIEYLAALEHIRMPLKFAEIERRIDVMIAEGHSCG
ncbi:MAG: PASTA domain-containing protein [bacterium]|nr:PASTA domain-containing protein [bacterium]